MRLLLNIIWVVLGGWLTALLWLLAAVLMAISIIGLPWARAAFNIAAYSFLPFGHRVVRRDYVTGRGDIGTGPLGFLGNIIWFILGGWYLVLSHLIIGGGYCLTIIGIPFGIAHFKLMKLSFAPVGKMIVPAELHRS